MSMRQRFGHWIAGGYQQLNDGGERMAEPIMGAPAEHFLGLGSQPAAEALLRETQGVAAIASRAISNRIASLEMEIVQTRRVSDGTTEDEVIDDHPAKLVLDNPSRTHNRRQQLSMLSHYLLSVGESYQQIIPDKMLGVPETGARQTRELHLLLPHRVTPLLGDAAIDRYLVRDGNGNEHTLPAEEVIRVWMPDPETLYSARGVLGPQAIEADAAKFGESHVRRHLEKNATPATVLEQTAGADSTFDPKAQKRFNTRWTQRFHNLKGRDAGLPAVLPPGFQLKELAAHRDIGSLVPLLEHLRDHLFQTYGVPRSIVGDVVDANRAAAETNQFVFDLHTIQPLASHITEAFTRQWIRPVYGAEFSVRFKDFVSGDKAFDLLREETRLRTMQTTINEVRTGRGEAEVDWGEEPVGTIGQAPYRPDETFSMSDDNPAALGGDDDEDDEGRGRLRLVRGSDAGTPEQRASWARVEKREKMFAPRMERAYRQVLAAQRNRLIDKLREAGLARSQRELSDSEILEIIASVLDPRRWTKLYASTTERIRRAAFAHAGQEGFDLVGVDGAFIFTDVVESILKGQGADLQERANATTTQVVARQIVRALAEGQAAGEGVAQRAKRIEKAVGQGINIRRNHSKTIARTETLKATQTAALEGARQTGVVQVKRWITSRDELVRDSHHIDGQEVPFSDAFELRDGEKLSAPGIGFNGAGVSARNAINCRCDHLPLTRKGAVDDIAAQATVQGEA